MCHLCIKRYTRRYTLTYSFVGMEISRTNHTCLIHWLSGNGVGVGELRDKKCKIDK